jgi:hypothetical protein
VLGVGVGVGAGVWLGQGVACADDGGSRPSGSSASGSGSSHSVHGAVRARPGGGQNARGIQELGPSNLSRDGGEARRTTAPSALRVSRPAPAGPVTARLLVTDVLSRLGLGQLDGLWQAGRDATRKPVRVSVTGHTLFAGDPAELSQWVSSDGSRVVYTAAVGSTTRVAVFDTATGEQLGATVKLAGFGVTTVAFAANGRAVVTTPTMDPTTLQTTSTRWAVIDTATGNQVGSSFSLDGDGSTVLSADGSHAVVTAHVLDWGNLDSSTVAVIDTTSGAQVGSTLTVAGYASTVLTADGSRAAVASSVNDSPTGSPSTDVMVIDTTTGAQVGATFTLDGGGSTVLMANDSRAIVTSSIYGSTADSLGTGVTVIDTKTGAQVGSTFTVAGNSSTVMRVNDSRAVVTAKPYDASVGSTSVAVVDTTTGAQVGSSFSLDGDGSTVLSADGSRAVLTARPYNSVYGGSTSVAVLDTKTGAQVGATFTLTGAGSTVLSADGSRVVVAAGIYDPTTYDDSSTSWAVLDTKTGAQVGATFTLDGRGSTVLSADGSRAVVTASFSGVDSTPHLPAVAVIDTATGQQVGSTFILPGGSGPSGVQSTVLNRDGSRAVVTVRTYDPGRSSFSSTVTVIDTGTGNQMGSTLTIAGSASTVLSADSSRAVVTTDTLRVAMVDTATGDQVGSTLRVSGIPLGSGNGDMVLSADGSRALIGTVPIAQSAITAALAAIVVVFFIPVMIFYPVVGPAIAFAQSFQVENWTVIDTATGARVGRTVTIPLLSNVQFGRMPTPVMNADGTRALVVGFTSWDPSNLFRLSTRVFTLRID